MSELATLFISNLPTIVSSVQKLFNVPEAAGEVAELVKFVQDVTIYLKQNEPLTTADKAVLDASIDAMITAPEQQPDNT